MTSYLWGGENKCTSRQIFLNCGIIFVHLTNGTFNLFFKNDSWFCWYFNIKISLFRQRGSERSYDGVYYDECIYHQC